MVEHLASERAALGGWSCGERITAIVFGLAAFAWIFRAPKSVGGIEIPGLSTLLPGLTDAGIAVCAAMFLFVAPVSIRKRRFALDWETAERVPWGVLLLFGGGLALAAAFDSSGLAQWLGGRLEGLGDVPSLALIATVALLFIFLTELTSNTAMTNLVLPILAKASVVLGFDPRILMIPATLSASCAFMMPIASPTQAIVFGSGYVPIRQMMRAGIWFNVLGIILVTIVFFLLGHWVMGINLTELPGWAN